MDQQIRVLVVDDDEPHAAAVAESLDCVGYDCVVATSAPFGLKLIEDQVFDIVITDLIMDGVGGLRFSPRLSASCQMPRSILTGHSTVSSASKRCEPALPLTLPDRSISTGYAPRPTKLRSRSDCSA